MALLYLRGKAEGRNLASWLRRHARRGRWFFLSWRARSELFIWVHSFIFVTIFEFITLTRHNADEFRRVWPKFEINWLSVITTFIREVQLYCVSVAPLECITETARRRQVSEHWLRKLYNIWLIPKIHHTLWFPFPRALFIISSLDDNTNKKLFLWKICSFLRRAKMLFET